MCASRLGPFKSLYLILYYSVKRATRNWPFLCAVILPSVRRNYSFECCRFATNITLTSRKPDVYRQLNFQHTVSCGSTEKSKFLQEDHSSQLIYILRRQLTGSKLNKIKHALAMKTNIPENENLTKGIFALARQWKCFLAGTEKGEVAFHGSSSLKRRVVGRGVLTQRDRAILLREGKASRQEDTPLNTNVPGILETVHESPKTTVEQSKDQGLYGQMINDFADFGVGYRTF